jgi:hypothetical protein
MRQCTPVLQGRTGGNDRDMVAMEWCCSTSKGNEVSSCAGGVAARPCSRCVSFGLEEAVWFKWNCL